MQNIWRELRAGPRAPDEVYVIVEIPKGSRNKYEYQKANGVIFLDRVLYSSMVYPGDYGLIPQTYYEDGDPLDILVMVNEPTFPVPATDPVFNGYTDLSSVPQSYLNEVAHFFEVYKDLEGQRTKPIGWEGAAKAKAEIERSMQLYKERFGLKEL